eukprot:scaffold3256_cov114-Isochrysis_galbana.AAC.19
MSMSYVSHQTCQTVTPANPNPTNPITRLQPQPVQPTCSPRRDDRPPRTHLHPALAPAAAFRPTVAYAYLNGRHENSALRTQRHKGLPPS